ncbi:MAG: aldo/keto reductase [Deltaproteobacteria bacterium]|nr:aldo/keto reductase [Deltaproteobacteria bacterium]
MKTASLVLSAIMVLASFLVPTKGYALSSSSQAGQMEYVEVIDRDGKVLLFSRLIMGTDHLKQGGWVHLGQTEQTDEEVFKVLDEAVRNGINVIDTSPIYVGNIENLIGRYLESRREMIKRDDFYVDSRLNPDRKIYVITKGGFPYDLSYSRKLGAGYHSDEFLEALKEKGVEFSAIPNGEIELMNVPPGTYDSRLDGTVEDMIKAIKEEIQHSLQNLNGNPTVYLLHRDFFNSVGFKVIKECRTCVEKILTALSSHELTQFYSMIGLSNWTTDRVKKAGELASKNPKLFFPTFDSPYFSLFEMRKGVSIHARGIQALHHEMMNPEYLKGVFMMPYSPLGGFSIFDKHVDPKKSWKMAKADAKQKFDNGDAYWQNVYLAIFTPENEIRLNKAIEFLKNWNQTYSTKYTLDQLLNAYALAHQRMNFLTMGPITVDQVQRSIQSLALSKQLNANDLDFLHESDPKKLLELDHRFSRKNKCLKFY